MDIKKKVEELVEKIQKNPKLLKEFQEEPVKVIEELTGLDLPDAEIKKLAEELKKQQTPPTSTGSYVWPCPSSKGITSGYGMRKINLYGYEKFHAGIDVGANMGASIIAADGGTVIVSTYDGGYGNYIMINHGGGRVTLYAHMSSRAVTVGTTVNKGQVIGYVGSTGNSTGPHLHFEVRNNGGTVDPLTYFSGYYFR